MRLGFACNWAPDEASTWSGTPFGLRAALRTRVDVADLGLRLGPVPRTAMKVLFAHRGDGRLVSTWDHSSLWARCCASVLPARATRQRCDAVLQIGDLCAFDTPFFCYQDLSVDVVLRHLGADGEVDQFPGMDRDALLRRRDRQLRVYERATGVLAMSEFLARDLVERSGLPAEKVHVVHPGASAVAGRPLPAARSDRRPRTRLLFIGRDFNRKGGDIVLAALARVRGASNPAISLTVAGPKTWPGPNGPPVGVAFLGDVPHDQVAGLLDSHDLFVMPSRFEGFGIAFAEALTRGVPCIARNAFAMPEVVRDGENGALVGGDDPDELGDAIVRTLNADEIYARCWDERAGVADHYTWARAAEETIAVVSRSIA